MRFSLILAGAILAGNAQAAEDLCSLQLQKLDDQATTTKPGNATQPQPPQLAELIAKAHRQQQAGELDQCERTAQEALTLIKGAGGGSASQ